MKIQFEKNGITVFESSLYRTTSTIIELRNSILIVDPNWLPIEVDYIKHYILSHYKKHTKYILFTHSDYDHIIGYGAFEDSIVITTNAFSQNKNKQSILQQITEFDQKYYIKRNYQISYPLPQVVVLQDAQSYMIDGIECIFFLSPGHTKDGMFTVIPEKRLWIAGDYLSNIEIPFIEDSFENYHLTLNKAKNILREFKMINYFIPGHGDMTSERAEIGSRIKKDLNYLKLLGKYVKSNKKSDVLELEKFILSYTDNREIIEANNLNIKQLITHMVSSS